MAIIQIPLRNDLDNYEFSVDLDGATYIMEIHWNDRTSQWSLILKDDVSNVLIGAVPLVINSDLIGRFQIDEAPQGVLTLLDISGTDVEPAKADLGIRCVLVYNEAT